MASTCTASRRFSDRRGMTLLNIVMLIMLLGALVLAGYALVSPLTKRGKIAETKKILAANVDAIISWSVANGRLPTQSEFQTILANPHDAWGGLLVYLYDDKLASSSAAGFGGVCGRTSTTTYNGQELAFILISRGEDATFESTPAPAAPPAQPFSGPPDLKQSDLFRIVSLHELKARAGCAGYTFGRLRIVNNELPNACSGTTSYSAVVTADGGSGGYTWSVISPGWVSIDNLTVPGKLSFSTAPTAGPVTLRVADSQGDFEQRTYTLKVVNCGIPPGTIPPGTPPDPPVQPPTNPGFNTADPALIEFGLNNNNTSACFWYPQNLPLQGKTMRAYWSFCYRAIDTSATSSTYADGYTFVMMQATNPTSYCGTGSTYNAVTNPRFDCSVMGGMGEYLAYCGIPGSSLALEFDIYPSGGRNDPAGSYNHLAVVMGTNTHKTGAPAGLYGDNTHNVGGNPACTTTSSGCLYDNMTGHTYPVNWLENTGCNATYDNHNARVEVHTRCNADCSLCGTGSCTTKALVKVWINRGNNNLDSNDVSAADLSYCTDLPGALNQYRVGFTQATGGAYQWGYIKNFSLKSIGSCPLATISPESLPAGTVGVPYTATLSASGGTPPYTNWRWSASTIPGITASNLPPGLSMSPTGVISGTPTAEGTYNTVLVSVDDACTADGCANTVSRKYSITINPSPCNAFTGWSGSLPNVTNCTAYSGSTTVLGGTSPFTWSLTAGSLPTGLTFCTGNTTASCTISGASPLASPGVYSFTQQVTDSCILGAQSTTQNATITVAADSCYSGGMLVRNRSGATIYYRRNGGACTAWTSGNATANDIAVGPADTIATFTNASCTATYCAAPITYCQQKPFDTNVNCRTRMNSACSYADQ